MRNIDVPHSLAVYTVWSVEKAYKYKDVKASASRRV